MGIINKSGKWKIRYGIPVILLVLTLISFQAMPFANAQENETANQTSPYVDPAILTVFEQNQTWVSVIIALLDNSNITVQGTKEERRNLSNQRADWFRVVEEIIVSNLSNSDIRNIRKHVGAFDAEISRQGFDKLANDTRIEKVILNYGGSPSIAIDQNQSMPQNTSSFENETTSEKTKEQIKGKELRTPRLPETLVDIIVILVILIVIISLVVSGRQKKNDKKN